MNKSTIRQLRNCLIARSGCMLFAASLAVGQVPSPAETAYVPTATFDVASIRESKVDLDRGFTMGGWFTPINSGNLSLTNNQMWNLVQAAYRLQPNEMEGLPWNGHSASYNIEAKSDAATDQRLAKLTNEQLQLEHQHMLQVLLAERFKLKVHWEDRDGHTYELVVAKPGRLTSTGTLPSPEELQAFGGRPIPPIYQRGSSARGFELIAHGASPAEIAGMLSGQFGHPVADRTNLRGKYDFDLKYHLVHADDRTDEDTNPLLSLETAIQDQLGLKLVPSRGPTRVLVVDHIEKPSEN